MKNKTKKILSAILILCMALPLLGLIQTHAANNNFLSSFKVAKKVIYKGNGVSISINDAKTNTSGLEIEFFVKNNSKKDYSISAHEFSINNLMAGGSVYGSDVDVPAGKKAKFNLNYSWRQNRRHSWFPS